MITFDRSKIPEKKNDLFERNINFFTLDDSFVVVVVDERRYEMYKIVVEIEYDMDI